MRKLQGGLFIAMVMLVGCHSSRPMLCQVCKKLEATVDLHRDDVEGGRQEHFWLCQSCADARTPPEVLERIRQAQASGETGAISGWTSYPLRTNHSEKP